MNGMPLKDSRVIVGIYTKSVKGMGFP
uniref:Uncharacterized protein n=1 Tax=Rhizophora mucronata TaxID=61149 RepID=A0A2P2QW46_RHIMU